MDRADEIAKRTVDSVWNTRATYEDHVRATADALRQYAADAVAQRDGYKGSGTPRKGTLVTHLKNLTPEYFCDRMLNSDLDHREIAEIGRRLEELESAKRTIDQEQAISVGLQKRLAKCEAVVRMYFDQHAELLKEATEGTTDDCGCAGCDAARAALVKRERPR